MILMMYTWHLQKHTLIKRKFHNSETIKALQILFSKRDFAGLFHTAQRLGEKICFCSLLGTRQNCVFVVASDLRPILLVWNTFNSRHVRAIGPKSGIVRLVNYRPAPILATGNESITPRSIPQPPESTSCIYSTLVSAETTTVYA